MSFIVGAGPAGLSAALILGRAGRPVLVCDAGNPRNVKSRALHALYFGLHVAGDAREWCSCNRPRCREGAQAGVWPSMRSC